MTFIEKVPCQYSCFRWLMSECNICVRNPAIYCGTADYYKPINESQKSTPEASK